LAPTCIEGSGGSQDGIATIAYPLKTQSSIPTFGNGGSLLEE